MARAPLVGRDAEWRELIRAYEAGGGGRLVVIEGEAGVGKTRLAEALIEHARTSDRATHCGEF